MKFKGAKKIKKKTADVIVGYDADGNPVSVIVEAMPLGGLESINDEIPEPTPPKGQVLRDGRGETIKDERGIPKQQLLTDDPDYLDAVAERKRAVSIAIILACLRDGEIEIETNRDDYEDPKSYYLAVRDEMSNAGVSLGALTRLLYAAMDVCDMSAGEIDTAKRTLQVRAEGNVVGEKIPTPEPTLSGASTPSSPASSPPPKARGKTSIAASKSS